MHTTGTGQHLNLFRPAPIYVQCACIFVHGKVSGKNVNQPSAHTSTVYVYA